MVVQKKLGRKKKTKKKKKSSWLVDWLAAKSKQKKKKSKRKAEEGRSLFHSHMDLEFFKRRRCQQAAVDFSRWFVTDFQWPNDGERGAATERNKAALTTLGVNVVEESVDAMNVGALLGNCGIDRDQVVLAVIQACVLGWGQTTMITETHNAISLYLLVMDPYPVPLPP